MTKKAHGIVDPWRKVEPLRAPPRVESTRHERIDIEDIDHDADLVIPGQYTIRSAHAGFSITARGVETPADALNVLADCVAALWLDKKIATAFADAGIGVRCKRIAYNVPSEETPASKLQGGVSALWFVDQTLDIGMLAMARIFRTPAAAPLIKKYGIVIMLTA